jgi:hypothetical protein
MVGYGRNTQQRGEGGGGGGGGGGKHEIEDIRMYKISGLRQGPRDFDFLITVELRILEKQFSCVDHEYLCNCL